MGLGVLAMEQLMVEIRQQMRMQLRYFGELATGTVVMEIAREFTRTAY